MKNIAAALTMVKDDYFFFEKWLTYYGELFGREALYVVCHGYDEKIIEMAKGCSIMHIPDGIDESFDSQRWRLLNNVANGLIAYFRFVILGDVDEYVVLDPQTKKTLPEFLEKRRPVVITPIGLEIVHQPDKEAEPIESGVLQTRKYCRLSSYYSKPCIIGKTVQLSRGGHFAKEPELRVFRNLYLFHLKYCDLDLYTKTASKRAKSLSPLGVENPKESRISTRWFSEPDGFGDRVKKLSFAEPEQNFDFSNIAQEMNETWGKRNKHGLWNFKKRVSDHLYVIPDRLSGVL